MLLLTVWTHFHYPWELTPPRWCLSSLGGLDEEFNAGPLGNLHNSTPQWEKKKNQHWCKTIKLMQSVHVVVLFGMKSLHFENSRCFPSMISHAGHVWVLGPCSLLLQPPLDEDSIRVGPFPVFFFFLTSSGHRRGDESHRTEYVNRTMLTWLQIHRTHFSFAYCAPFHANVSYMTVTDLCTVLYTSSHLFSNIVEIACDVNCLKKWLITSSFDSATFAHYPSLTLLGYSSRQISHSVFAGVCLMYAPF